MKWLTMDANNLEFPDGHFDAVIEKGMFDALFAGTGLKVQPVLSEAHRVLRKGGTLFSVTYSGNRISELFQGQKGSLDEAEVPKDLSCRVAGALRTKPKQRKGEKEGKERDKGEF